MSSLIILGTGLSKWLAPTVGVGVFGLTAGVGQLLSDGLDAAKGQPMVGVEPEDGGADWSGEFFKGRTGGSDRRELYRRYGTPLRVAVADDRQDEITTGWVVDRSSGGLGLELEIPVPAGTVLHLRPTQVPGMQFWVASMVRNCRDHLDYWKVGCQFMEPPPWNLLRLFG